MTLLASSSAATSVENTDTGLRIADTCLGQEAINPLATIPSLDSPATNHPQTNQCSTNQLTSKEDDLAQVQEIAEKYELESGQSLNVKGNLKKNLEFWKSIGAPNFILTTIENGYKLPLASFPVATRLRNNKSARLHADFVDQAVLELVNSGRVRKR